MTCGSCGDKPKKCNKDFTRAVVEIDNPEQITLMRKVTIPASMGDDTTVPPVVGKYKNVVLYYEANSKTYLYSSDGIPTQLVNGVTDYEAAVNLPQINGHTLLGNKTGDQLGLQNKLTAGENISIDSDNVISAVDTTYGPATDTEIGLVKPGAGLEVASDGSMSISDIEQYAHSFDTVADMKASTNLENGDYARTGGYYSMNDGGGSLYKIGSSQPSDHYETLDNGLYAELIVDSAMNVLQFGIRDDAANVDYTATIQQALKCGTRNLMFNDGTYTITAGLEVECSVYGAISGQTTISFPTADPTSVSNSMFIVFDQENIYIKGINFVGNFDSSNPGPIDGTSEHAHAIALKNSHNVTIQECKGTNINGDFVFTSGGRAGEAHAGPSTNITVSNCIGDEFKRCFVSFVHCDKVIVSDNTISKQYSYVAMFDIEPNDSAQHTTEITIRNNYIDTIGIVVQVYNNGHNQVNPKMLSIINNYIGNCTYFFTASLPDGVTAPYIDDLLIEGNYCANFTSASPQPTTNIFGVKNGTVKGNTIPQTISIRYSKNINVEGNNAKGVYVSLSSDVVIFDNIIQNADYLTTANCIAISSGERIFASNNLMSQTRLAVRVQLADDTDTVIVKNNTIITSKWGIYAYPTSDYAHTNIHLCDNEIIHNVQDDTNPDTTFVTMEDYLNKQCDTSNYFLLSGQNTTTQYITGVTGQYVKNTAPTLLSDADGSYYLKGWLCVDGSNQTWIEDKLRV